MVLQSGQGLFQWLGHVEVVDDHPEAPQVRGFRADQFKHQLQKGIIKKNKQTCIFFSFNIKNNAVMCFIEDVSLTTSEKSSEALL